MIRLLLIILTISFTTACSTSQKAQQVSAAVAEEQNTGSSQSDAGGPPTKQQMLGFWKMVELPNKEVNQVNPWPQPFQWFAFYEDGKVYSMMTSQDGNYTAKELDELFKTLPKGKTPNYTYDGQFMRIDNPSIRNYLEVWGINLFAKDIEGLAKKGDIIMSLDDGKGSAIYYRLLRRVE